MKNKTPHMSHALVVPIPYLSSKKPLQTPQIPKRVSLNTR